MRYRWLILLLCVLGGCSRETQAPPSLPPRAAAVVETPDARPAIVAFGDSLSAGHGLAPGLGYPEFLQKLLDAQGYGYRVVNAGISGDTTSGGVARLESVTSLRPAVVVLELGANDGLRGLPVETTRENLERMITALQGAGAQVVLAGMTLPPNYGAVYIRDFEKVFRDLARRHRLPLIPFLLEGVATDRTLMQPDGLHPTAEGNRRVAETVARTVTPLLRK